MVLTRRRSALAQADAVANVLLCKPALAIIAERLGLRHIDCLLGVCHAMSAAGREAQRRWAILEANIPLNIKRLETIERELSDTVGGREALYLCARTDGKGVAIPRGNRILLISPTLSLSRLNVSGCGHGDWTPDLRGIAVVHEGDHKGDFYLIERPPDMRPAIGDDGRECDAAHVVNRLQALTKTSTRTKCRSSDSLGPLLDYPSGLAMRHGRVYVSDTLNHRIVCFDWLLRHLWTVGGFGFEPGRLFTPYGLDASDDHLYVCDNGNDRISVHRADSGAFVRTLGDARNGFGLTQPRDCAVVELNLGVGPTRLLVTEPTRLTVLSLETGEPLQFVRFDGALSLWGVCVVETTVWVLDAEKATIFLAEIGLNI